MLKSIHIMHFKLIFSSFFIILPNLISIPITDRKITAMPRTFFSVDNCASSIITAIDPADHSFYGNPSFVFEVHTEIIIDIPYIFTNPGAISNRIYGFKMREPIEYINPMYQHITDLISIHPIPIEMPSNHIFHIRPFRSTDNKLVTPCMIIDIP